MISGIKLHVWGAFACFTRPELKAERFSYEVMTPSAAIGVLSAIYWKPEIRWVIDRIHVLKPIRFFQVRRNEVDGKFPKPKKEWMQGGSGNAGMFIEERRQQRASTILRDVEYLIEAHIEVLKADENPAIASEVKHLEMFKRRASKGQCFHQPYFGTREFPVDFEFWEEESAPPSELPERDRNRNLGLMLHEIDYIPDQKGKIVRSNDGVRVTAQPRFFMASLEDGIMSVPPLSETMN